MTPSPWVFQELHPSRQERHPFQQAPTAGGCELVGKQVLVFLSPSEEAAEKEPEEVGVGLSREEEEK